MRRKYGLLSELQYKVLQLRIERGLTQKEVAKILGTTRENVAIIEKRAKRNIKLAEETLRAYKMLLCAKKVTIEPGTHLVDVPSIIVRASDSAGVKLRASFTKIYDEIRFRARDCISGTKVVKPFTVAIYRNGDIEVLVE